MKTVFTGVLPVITGKIPVTTITTFVDTGKATVATGATLVFTVGAYVKAVFIGFLKNPVGFMLVGSFDFRLFYSYKISRQTINQVKKAFRIGKFFFISFVK